MVVQTAFELMPGSEAAVNFVLFFIMTQKLHCTLLNMEHTDFNEDKVFIFTGSKVVA